MVKLLLYGDLIWQSKFVLYLTLLDTKIWQLTYWNIFLNHLFHLELEFILFILINTGYFLIALLFIYTYINWKMISLQLLCCNVCLKKKKKKTNGHTYFCFYIFWRSKDIKYTSHSINTVGFLSNNPAVQWRITRKTILCSVSIKISKSLTNNTINKLSKCCYYVRWNKYLTSNYTFKVWWYFWWICTYLFTKTYQHKKFNPIQLKKTNKNNDSWYFLLMV